MKHGIEKINWNDEQSIRYPITDWLILRVDHTYYGWEWSLEVHGSETSSREILGTDHLGIRKGDFRPKKSKRDAWIIGRRQALKLLHTVITRLENCLLGTKKEK